jgi:hypothetical protein
MNGVLPGDKAGLPERLASRRSMLRGGTLLGLSAAAAACAPLTRPPGRSPASAGQTGAGTSQVPPAGRLALDYKPSQVTGWSPSDASPTLGGHIGSTDFSWLGKTYRVSLLPFGQAGHAPNPVYEDEPGDTTVKFKHTLASKWGTYYTFRYLGGSDRGARFTVESYGAFHGKPLSPRAPGMVIGADLYVVYHPGRGPGNPAVNNDLQFIQVVYYQIGTGTGDNLVDTDRANPFYGEGGGLTSIDGNQSVSFSDFVRQGFDGKSLPPNLFIAETFLAQDTRTKNSAGKDIVNIFGGLKWGWQMRNVS